MSTMESESRLAILAMAAERPHGRPAQEPRTEGNARSRRGVFSLLAEALPSAAPVLLAFGLRNV